MTDWFRQSVNDNGFWQRCRIHGVEPSDPIGNEPASFRVDHLHTSGARRGYVKLIDDSSGAVSEPSEYVLMSDQLSPQIVQRVTVVLQVKRLSSGYLIRDALDYKTVYLIDPEQHFSDEERTIFIENDRSLVEISGSTADEMAQDLESKLS